MELVHSNPTRDIKELSRRKKALQEGKNMANGDSFVGQAGRGGADHASGGDRRGGRGAAAALENETPPLDDAIFDPNQLPFMIFDDINDDDYNGEGGGGGRDGLDDEDDEEGEGEDMDGSSAVHFLPRSTRSRGGPVPLEDLNAVFRMGGSSSRRSRIIYDDDDEEEEEEARETGDEDETDEWDDDSSSAGGGGGGRRDESRRKRRLISSTSSAASVSSAQVRTTPRPVKTSRVSYKEDDASDIDLMDLEGDDDDLSASLTRRVNNNKSSSTKSKNKMLLLPLAPTLPWKVSEWVCSTSPDPVSYHPQLGDAVAYLRKGHERFLEKNADVCECKQLLDSDIVFAYVKEIHWTPYAVQHPPDFRQALPKCRLGLEIIPTRSLLPQLHEIRPSRKGKRKLEYVQFWEDDGLAPFIVLLEVYEAGMSQSLHVGDEVNVLYDSEVHSATIAAIAGPDDNLPGYPWECAKVDWGFTFGDAAPCDVNLWEVRKVADASSSRTRASSLTRRSVSPTRTSATSSSRKSLSTFTSSDFLWTEKLDANGERKTERDSVGEI